MTESRWLAWTGPLYAVLFAIGLFALDGSTPNETASSKEIIAYFSSHKGRTMTQVFATPLLVVLLLLFFAYLRSLARGSGGVGPTVMFGGAVLWASGMLVTTIIELTLVTSADHGQEQVAQVASVMGNDSWMPFIAGIAVTLIGAGMTVMRSGILPAWLGWVALVAGVVSLAGPGGFLGFFVSPLWVLIAGVLLAAGKAAASDPAVV